MGAILPTFYDDEPLSATKMNVISRMLREVKSVADVARNPTIEMTPGKDGTITGYIVHHYNTLNWYIANHGSATLTYNGVNITMSADSGSADLSSLSLTVGKMYEIKLSASSSSVVARYVYESHSETYGSGPPSFTGDTAAQTITDLNTVVDYVDDLINLANRPPTTFNGTVGDGWWERGEGDTTPVVLYTGYLRHIHDKGEVKFWHQSTGWSTNSHKSRIKLAINGTTVLNHIIGRPHTTSYVTAIENEYKHVGIGNGKNAKKETVSATLDISGLSLTVGTWYKWEITQEGSGTAKPMILHSRAFWLAESALSPSWTNPPKWTANESVAPETRLNTYTTCINYLHPGASSPSSPVYYDNLVQWASATTKRYTNKALKYLAYIWDGSGTPNVKYAKTGYGMKGKAGVMWSDTGKVKGLFPGLRLSIDDVHYVQQVDDVNNL